jgi:RNA polymerase sigma-70 factor (ECF subfamily)
MSQVYIQSSNELTDEVLIKQSLGGDKAAFESLTNRHRKRLFRVARRMLSNREEAEDAVQEALLGAYRNLSSFQGNSTFSTWLCTIVTRTSLRQRRSRRKHAGEYNSSFHLSIATSPEGAPDVQIENRELLEKLFPFLEELSVRSQTVLILRIAQELEYSEIARMLGITIICVKRRIARARQQIRTRAREWQVL